MSASATPGRWWPAAAAGAVASLCGVAVAVGLHRYVVARAPLPVRLAPDDLVLATAYPVIAAVIVAHQRRNLVGWLLLSSAFTGLYLAAGQYAALSLIPGRTVPAAAVATWISIWGYVPYLILIGLVPMYFPDGTLPPGRLWRRIRDTIAVLIVAETMARMVAPVPSDASPGLHNPLAVPHAQWLNVATLVLSVGSIAGGGSCAVIAVWIRLRRSAGEDRNRLQWLVFGAACLLGCAVVGAVSDTSDSEYAFAAGLLLLAASIAVGAIRHHLFDIGTALSRTLVYGPMTVLLVIAYAATVAGAGTLPVGRRATYAVVAVVALVGAAARDQVQRLVDRLVFGARRSPFAVLEQVHGRLDLATGPLDALGQLCAGVRSVLKLPFVAVYATDGRLPPTETGRAVPDIERFTVHDRAEPVGTVVVGHRHPDERFTRGERVILDDVARRAGALLGSAAMFHDLERSRHGLVAAREEERRRLRHDLHDSVGPRLAAMAMQLDSITERLATLDPDLATRASRLGTQMRGTVGEIRRVVEDLRPPALDDLGLAGSLSQLVEPYTPTVAFTADPDLVGLPAATEVAAFRIAAEAVTNAIRHARCTRCTLTLRRDLRWLIIEVVDDGIGLDPDVRPGVGLHSIRERASEIGGRLEVTGAAGGGTVIRARLPVETAPAGALA